MLPAFWVFFLQDADIPPMSKSFACLIRFVSSQQIVKQINK